MKAIVLFCLLLPTLSLAKTHEVKDGSVTFLAVGSPGFLRINGEEGHLSGKVQEEDSGLVNGEFVVNLEDFKTGMSLRDRHMKEKYLLTGKHPTARLVLNKVKTSKGKFPWKGLLTLKGKEGPVEGQATIAEKAGAREITAVFDITLSDFGIGVPSYLGITVAEKVTITVSFKVGK